MAPASADAEAAKPAGRHVLVVEDDGASRDAMTKLCRLVGHTCTAAPTRAEALYALLTLRPDAVLLDLMLPDGNGLEVLRLVRTRQLGTKVAVMTGASDPVMLDEVDRLRPDALFRKAADFQQVRAWLDSP